MLDKYQLTSVCLFRDFFVQRLRIEKMILALEYYPCLTDNSSHWDDQHSHPLLGMYSVSQTNIWRGKPTKIILKSKRF